MKRVDWTESELDKLFVSFRDIAQKEPKLGFTKVATLMQVVLPENRHRKIHQISNVPEPLRKKLIDVGLLDKDWEANRRHVGPPDPNVERMKQIADERDSALAELENLKSEFSLATKEIAMLRKTLETIPSEAQVVKGFFSDILKDAAARAGGISGGPASPHIADVIRASARHQPEMRREGDKNGSRPVVVLAGIKTDKRSKYMTAFQERINLKFWHSDAENLHQLKAIIERAEIVFIMLADAGHDTKDVIKASGKKYQMVNGADSSMFDQINGWLERRAREGVSNAG